MTLQKSPQRLCDTPQSLCLQPGQSAPGETPSAVAGGVYSPVHIGLGMVLEDVTRGWEHGED